MEHSSKPPHRARYAAMRDDQKRDDQGEKALDEHGVKFSQRPKPPRQVRDSRRAPEPRRDRPSTRPDPRSSRRRRHSRDRSRDRATRPSPDTSRRVPEANDLIPRYRERHREPFFDRVQSKKVQKRKKPPAKDKGLQPRVCLKEARSTPLTWTTPNVASSPAESESGSRRTDREGGHGQPSRSRSPMSEHRPSSSRRAQPLPTEVQRAPEFEQPISRRQHPPRSPHASKERRSREGSPGWRHSSRSDIDEDMTSRGNSRGSYNHVYPQKPHMGNDPYAQSPQNSYHNSPSRSPYGSSRGGRNGQQPHSQHPQGSNYGPPSGPSSQYHSNPSRSPPHAAPTGPMQQYPQGGSYRGGYRGGGFRGNSFGNRGRGGFKNSHWNQGPPQRGHHDDLSSGRFSNVDESNAMDIDHMDGGDESYQIHDRNAEDVADVLTTPNRPPPVGPGSQSQSGGSGSKFSFAFKPSSKPVVTAPKPEISQKLNAAPRRDAQKDSRESDRDRSRDHDRGRDRDRDRDRERDREKGRDRDREPPRSAPTEPASSRPRYDRRQPPEGPRAAPRMRKVKKIMKRPKPKPSLSADLVDSESVFFRKPGNESVVGSGTYGKVFKGLNVYTKGMVALKKIRMEGERDGFPVTAVREIKLLQSLRHVNIVNLQEVMVEKNDCFMVFEYLSHDLTGLLNHPTFKLDASQKKHLARQMFEGLDYLHTRGVLHRDIKAANILVSNEGVLKIADFGLARFYAKRHQLDYTNRVITIWYRSPELLLGETKYTAAVDVWSAACVMVEIFDRNAIFPGDGTEFNQLEKVYNVMGTPNLKDWPGLVDMPWFELMRPTVKKRNIFAEKYREKMSPAAFQLLSTMFHYDPAKRPSAAEVLQHTYFTDEEPPARQATELSTHNDWHEFESKALRKENDRREREARKLAKEGASREMDKDKDKKRINEGTGQPDAKRLHVDKNGGNRPTPAAISSKPTEA
ncbi:cmgc cdk crk7 kinase [Fusarium longipes]|uniref:cyclin-dependent kinase n=1 Tax=Fusarium longipes TaxID=694270 RepID=A0A395RZ53_9HYPO|nr:cmgc cdk crk7 kinase [Fusarium longipes]